MGDRLFRTGTLLLTLSIPIVVAALLISMLLEAAPAEAALPFAPATRAAFKLEVQLAPEQNTARQPTAAGGAEAVSGGGPA